MGPTALGISVLLYLATAAEFWMKGDRWMACAFVFYACANVCFMGVMLR